ncbi:MAG: cytochrome c-type biogenesis protein CcmH [Acidobacteriota bacterium]|nr:cytochrome c-type biogenesis protein CcmH [Acidobacteriota bacterium]
MSASRWTRLSWAALALVLAAALAVGAHRPSPAPGPAQRAAALDAALRCPSCQDVSVAASSAPTAVAIRRIVATRVDAGQSDAAIEAFLVSRYGPDILLRPATSGGVGAVWFVPLVAVPAALAVLGVFLWRRRRVAGASPSEDDRRLVEAALSGRAGPAGTGGR